MTTTISAFGCHLNGRAASWEDFRRHLQGTHPLSVTTSPSRNMYVLRGQAAISLHVKTAASAPRVSCQGWQNVLSTLASLRRPPAVDSRSSTTANPTTNGNDVQNDGVYDVAGMGIRIGVPVQTTDAPSNLPDDIHVTNNLVEGYGPVIPSSIAIVQGNAYINTYSNNELYDSYHGGIEICALGKNKRKLLHYGTKLN
jgi:hypothetical protein